MTDPRNSYRSIVRSTGIIAGAQLGVLLIGLIRAKLFALWVGPAGIGLLGILNSLLANASLVAGMGLGTSAVQQIANADEDAGAVRRAVLWLAVLLGIVGGTATWLLREPLSLALSGDPSLADAVGWMGLAVALTVFAAALIAVLQGRRRLGDLAMVQLGGTLLGVIGGVAAVALFGMDGIVVAAIVAPAGLVIAGLSVQRRLSLPDPGPAEVTDMVRQWGPILAVGIVIMATALIAGLTQTLLRALVLRELGLDQLGLFQAAIGISTMNVTLVLTAMAADYYPRLSQLAAQREGLRQLLNEQLHVAVLASLPILTLLSAASGLWLTILYSPEFTPAADLMRWLALGEAIRLPLWALGYVLLARRDTAAYVCHELSFGLVSLPVTWLGIGAFGIEGAGIGYVTGYGASLAVTLLMVKLRHGLTISLPMFARWLLLVGVAAFMLLIGELAPGATPVVGFPLALLLTWFALSQLQRQGALPAGLTRILRLGRKPRGAKA